MASGLRAVSCMVMVSLVVSVALIGCGGSAAPEVIVEDAWARPSMTMPMMTERDQEGGSAGSSDVVAEEGEVDTRPESGATGAVFMKLLNRGGQADSLVSAETDVATKVELHKTTMTDGVMKMSPVKSIEIPARGEVILKPGDFHIMLMGLNKDLNVGDRFGVKLNFEKSGPLELDVTVQEM
jgi:copper(I)-binding protein